MSMIELNYVEQGGILTVTGSFKKPISLHGEFVMLAATGGSGVTISLYSEFTIKKAKEFLEIADATNYSQTKTISEKKWERFLKMEY